MDLCCPGLTQGPHGEVPQDSTKDSMERLHTDLRTMLLMKEVLPETHSIISLGGTGTGASAGM